MDVNEAIYHRRATRHFSDRPVGKAMVEELLRAATQAPSALNLQPWAFAVFHGRALLQGLSQRAKSHLVATLSPMFELHPASQRYSETDFNVFYDAGTLIVIYATGRRFHPTEDCCLAAQNLMLAAHGAGLATCPVGFVRPWFDLPEVKQEFGIPATCLAVFPVAVGYAAEPPAPVPRDEPDVVAWVWREE